MDEGVRSLIKDAAEAASELRDATSEGQEILIFTNLDADGLSSAGIIGTVLARNGSPFMVRVVNQLSEEDYEFAAKHGGPVILTDLGSGYLEEIDKKLPKKIFVFDHHVPRGRAGEKVVQVNPHIHGIDGAREISASGVSYLVAREYDYKSRDIAALAVVGALGDLQDKAGRRELRGANEIIVNDAEEAGVLSVTEDLIFFGRESRPIHRSISSTTEPFLPGLTGEDDAVIALLVKSGIKLKEDDRWRTIGDLSVEEKQIIFASVMQKLIADGFDTSSMLSLTGKVYTLVKEDRWTPLRDARELAVLLNACGRLQRQGAALALCLGERGAIVQECLEAVEEYKRTIRMTMERLLSTPGAINKLEHFVLIRGEGIVEERMLGAISSVLHNSPIIEKSKPLFATALLDERSVRVSGRVDASLAKFIDISKILSEASKKFDGSGGGHNVAAGATIPRKKILEFFDEVSKMIEECEKNQGSRRN
ncbi:MAG: DHHA1 domain-containing protein [Thermoproteota archaeon]